MSEEEQSADRQTATITRWLDAQGLTVTEPHWYVDEGWKRHQAQILPQFNAMLRAVDDGRIQWIVVDRADRFGTKSKKQLIHYLYLLEEARCRLVTVEGKDLTADDFATFVLAGYEGEKSEGEGRDKSHRVLSEMLERANRGQWLGGKVPYAMGVAALVLDGGELVERWRVRIVGKQNRWGCTS